MVEAIIATKKQAITPTTEWRSKRSGFHFKKGRSFSKKKNTGSSNSSCQSSVSILNYPDYGKKHKGACHRASGACFRCGKTGYMVRDCPMRSNEVNRPVASLAGFVSAARSNNARGNTDNETLRQGRVFTLVPKMYRTPSLWCQPACDVLIGDITLYVDLLHLSIDHFDCILGMDWLTKYCASIDCVNKYVVFHPPGMPEFVFTGNGVVSSPYLISAMKAVKLLRKGCRGYLCCALTASSDCNNVETIPVVCEFPDVFPNDLPRDLVDREIEFTIENEIEVVVREQDGILAAISTQPAIIEEIKEKQCEDEFLRKIVDEIDSKSKSGFVLDNDVLKF
ncbi:uncharacterized protein LOC114318858 [Camellia sinensis]|uniref:uncharacterized protein LOC114318858 n=1 Tax=Camellia sinensis TaxID=4442 RepID=UPI001035FC46|nr:uncharacterized protein LOC114318858 [Camellia sinensis]